MTNKKNIAEIHIGCHRPILFAFGEQNELVIPVCINANIDENTCSSVKFKIIPVDYSQYGVAIEIYFTPKHFEKSINQYMALYEAIREKFTNHILYPGTFLGIRGDNWINDLHLPAAIAMMRIGRNGNLYLERDGAEDEILDPEIVEESLIGIATIISEIYAKQDKKNEKQI